MINGRKDCPVMIHSLPAGSIFADGNEKLFIVTAKTRMEGLAKRYIVYSLDDGKAYMEKPHDLVFPVYAEWSYE